jgi:DNA-binding response OmpR family regulator
MQILIIEDERSLRESIAEYLLNNGYDCTSVGTFAKGLEKSMNFFYDCILVDVGLPDGNGINIIKTIKKSNPETGIIIISAKNSLDDKIVGLEVGADDYLTKPFHLSELNARINSVIRRRNFGGKNYLEFNNLIIKTTEKQVLVNGNPLKLTKKEYDILVYLAGNPSHLVTKEALAEAIWGDKSDMATSFDFVYSQIKNLKKKLNDAGAKEFIKVVYGMGYKFI